MVQITPEEVMAQRKGVRIFDELSEMDKDIVGKSGARIHIPLTDVYNLRRIAGLLNGLAADLEALSRRRDMKARTILLETRASVADVNRRISQMTGKGKTPKPYRTRRDAEDSKN